MGLGTSLGSAMCKASDLTSVLSCWPGISFRELGMWWNILSPSLKPRCSKQAGRLFGARLYIGGKRYPSFHVTLYYSETVLVGQTLDHFPVPRPHEPRNTRPPHKPGCWSYLHWDDAPSTYTNSDPEFGTTKSPPPVTPGPQTGVGERRELTSASHPPGRVELSQFLLHVVQDLHGVPLLVSLESIPFTNCGQKNKLCEKNE